MTETEYKPVVSPSRSVKGGVFLLHKGGRIILTADEAVHVCNRIADILESGEK